MDEEDVNEQQEVGVEIEGNSCQTRVGRNKGKQPQSVSNVKHD